MKFWLLHTCREKGEIEMQMGEIDFERDSLMRN